MSTIQEDSARPFVDFDQEVRFAVVLYGGSSLAIYINGVAQELLRLVRATAPDARAERVHLRDKDLRASERVYRRLGRVLGRQAVRGEHAAVDGQHPQPDADIRTRFVVDILTGTSAGGINAVYLAKALANDQDMDELKHLWVTEGDINVLINDEESYKNLEFGIKDLPGEPWSVLNSRRMYFKLLDALRGMDKKRTASPKGTSPLVDELDLFITATDMQGRVLQLRLADKVVSEYRHRNVFRFRYRNARASGIEQSDFGPEYNAFLAFVARATSAHQAAFSPINLNDVTPILEKYPMKKEYSAAEKALRDFYSDYLLQLSANEDGCKPPDQDELAEAFRKLWFVDGGTLDNKPFSFVIGELPLRNADNFVDRKLLYVEPSPEHLTRTKSLEKRPRIVQNALAALSSLPRYETIVEDLTRLLERNRMIERLDHIMRGMEADLSRLPKKKPRKREQFLEMLKDPHELTDWMQKQGPSWGSYMRLRVAEVTDDLTLLVARAAGFDEESDEFLAIRYLVRDWRDRQYDAYMTDNKWSQLQFLVEFDLLWAIRRIQFVIKRLNDVACLTEKDENARRIAGIPYQEAKSSVFPREGEFTEFHRAVRHLRKDLNKTFVRLRRKRRRFWSAGATNPFINSIARLQITSQDLLGLLHEPTDEKRRYRATQLMNTPIDSPETAKKPPLRIDAVEDLAKEIKKELGRIAIATRNKLSKTLRPHAAGAGPESSKWDTFLRETLWYYYISFEDFDQIAYPLLYSTAVGAETDIIDVFRVSPEDATALINENCPVDERGRAASTGRRVRKLAGTTLGNFGAFFEQKFRINDIMWGRLDAAERIIATVLTENGEVRQQLTDQAHRAILVEENLFADKSAADDMDLQALVWRALDVWDNQQRRIELLKQAAQKLTGNNSATRKTNMPLFRDYLNKLCAGAEPCDLFREEFMKDYDAARQFTSDGTLKSAKRANRVLNDMAGGYLPPASERSWTQWIITWLGRRIRTFVEAAIEPDGSARRVQLVRLVIAYGISLAILVLVPWPAFYLVRSGQWPKLGWIAIVLSVPLAPIPLALTLGYSIMWHKLRRKLVGLMPRPSKT